MDEDELVRLCLPLWRDKSLDDDDRFEEALPMISEASTITARSLDEQILRVCGRCRDIVNKEIAEEEKERLKAALKAKSERESSHETAPGPSAASAGVPSYLASTLNPLAAEFKPGQPITARTVPTIQLTDAQKREIYKFRKAAVEATMKQKDIQIAHLQSQIKSHGEEMQRLEASRAEALQQVSARPQPVLTGDPQQRTLLSQIQQAEDRLAVLRPARARMMNDLKTAREELNELYGELLPEEGELGPGQ